MDGHTLVKIGLVEIFRPRNVHIKQACNLRVRVRTGKAVYTVDNIRFGDLYLCQ